MITTQGYILLWYFSGHLCTLNYSSLIFKFYLYLNRSDRYCKETTVINGVTIPKGAAIIVPISVLHHSPLYWKEPEKFDPDR